MKNRLYISIFFTFIFVAVLSLYATATSATEDYTAYIKDLGFSITIPAPYYMPDSDTAETDFDLPEFKIDKEETSAANRYLYAVTGTSLPDKQNYDFAEIIITGHNVEASQNYDFSALDDYSLEYIAVSNMAMADKDTYKYDIYKHPEMSFVELHYSVQDGAAYGISYLAVYNGKAVVINFNIWFATDADVATYTDIYTRYARDIMSTIVFDEISHMPSTPSFEYTDKYNNVSFTVPENWSIRNEKHDQMNTTAFFTIENSPINIVGYSCFIPLNDPQIAYPKEEYEAFLAEYKPDHEDMYSILRKIGCEENSICQNTYANVEYFRGTEKIERNGFETEITYLIRYHNGYVYYFTLTGNHDYFGDLVSLIQSVNYPLSEAELQAEHDEKSREKANQKAAAETISDNAFTTHLVAEEKRWNVVKIAAIIVCAVVIVVFEVKFIKKKD